MQNRTVLILCCHLPLLFITTSKKKTGFLLIETFRKLFNPQNDGHQGLVPWWPFLYIRVSKNFAIQPISDTPINVRGFKKTCPFDLSFILS